MCTTMIVLGLMSVILVTNRLENSLRVRRLHLGLMHLSSVATLCYQKNRASLIQAENEKMIAAAATFRGIERRKNLFIVIAERHGLQ